MKIAILGHGVEGKSAEKYFSRHNHEIQIFDPFKGSPEEIQELNNFDLVMRSPSIPPRGDWSSVTKYFFQHCPCPIIGITGTKGKGTTCSLVNSVLESIGHKTWLVGNIGNPALDVFDQISPKDVVIYEMSSFQLWDMKQSPHIAAVLRIEPDHLNVHTDYADYVNAKSHITTYQNEDDICVFYKNNPDSQKIATLSRGTKIPYPTAKLRTAIDEALENLSIVGPHNRENAEAALMIVATFEKQPLDVFFKKHQQAIAQGLHNFYGLPHRLQFVRTLNNVSYYDDSFATNAASLSVALKSFPSSPIMLIVGGRDKTDNEDLPEIVQILKDTKNLAHVILIGESGHEIAERFTLKNAETAKSLPEAVKLAQKYAEAKQISQNNAPVVLLSPAAASFDMFENAYARGDLFQKTVKGLK